MPLQTLVRGVAKDFPRYEKVLIRSTRAICPAAKLGNERFESAPYGKVLLGSHPIIEALHTRIQEGTALVPGMIRIFG